MENNKHHIDQIEFLGSFPRLALCPGGLLPEYAFLGRSNVGKSSLINMLCGRKEVARISKQPGKTQAINLFEVDGEWRIADLPGYGYAKVSKSQREKWGKMIREYLRERRQLVAAFLLLDFRLAPQEADMEFARWMGENGVPFALAFTKTDKVKASKKQGHLNAFTDRFKKDWTEMPPYFITSALKEVGRKELLDYITGLNKSFRQAAGKQR